MHNNKDSNENLANTANTDINNKYTVILQHPNSKQGVVAYTGYSFAFAVAGFLGVPLLLLLIFKQDYKSFFIFLAYIFISALLIAFLTMLFGLQQNASTVIYVLQALYIIAVFVLAKFYNKFYINNLLKKGYTVVFNSSNMHFTANHVSQLVFNPTEILQVKDNFYKASFTRLALAVAILIVLAFILK